MERKQVLKWTAAGAAGAAAVVVAGTALGGLGLAALWRKRRRQQQQRPGTNLRGQSVLITGGSRGLGLAMAREFAREGCRVAICARDADELERARKDIASLGGEVIAVTCDVTNRDDVEKTVKDVRQSFGSIDILVNNAGVIQVGPIETMDLADFENAMAVMFWGPLYFIKACLPQMRERHGGRIVNITSIGGKVSVPHLIPYSCAKFAAVALSEGLRAEVAKDNVQVTTIVPGLMRTGSHLHAQFKGDHANEFRWFSLGAATPVTSISATRAARTIVRAAKRGCAMRILSVPANLMARLHGAMPEITLPVFGIVNQLALPQAPDTDGHDLVEGAEAERRLNSMLHRGATVMGRAAAKEFNEVNA